MTSLHEATIRMLHEFLDPNRTELWRRKDFWKKVKNAIGLGNVRMGEVSRPDCIPDLFRIIEVSQQIDVIEVEDTSRLSTSKIISYGTLFAQLDAIEWDLRVFVCDRYGSDLRSIPVWELMMELTTEGHVEVADAD